MTATDPRPELAAMLLERLAPAAEALAASCAEDIGAGPPPRGDRDRAEYPAGRDGASRARTSGRSRARIMRARARTREAQNRDPAAASTERTKRKRYAGTG